jgi:hypothetical protein
MMMMMMIIIIIIIIISGGMLCDSVFGIANRYGQAVRGSNPVGSRNFMYSTAIQTDSGVHTAFCTVGTGALFSGAKWPVRGVDHPPFLTLRLRTSGVIFLLPLDALISCYSVIFTF